MNPSSKSKSIVGDERKSEVSASVGPIASAIEVPRREFPNGRTVDDYADYEKWTNRRWAWEFLCRNKRFRSECEQLDKISPDLPEHKQVSREIARTFHLRKFIHYTTAFQRGKQGPRFNPVLMLWKIDAGATNRKTNLVVFDGQCLARFDLHPALEDAASLDAQIEYVRKELQTNLKRLRTRVAAQPAGDNSTTVSDSAQPEVAKNNPARRAIQGTRKEWLLLLRTLDAKAAGMPHADILELLYPERCVDEHGIAIARREWPARLKSRARKAHELAENRYLSLALPKKKQNSSERG